MKSKWLDALKEEDIHNAAALRAQGEESSAEPQRLKTPTSKNSKITAKDKATADTLGLIAKWSRHFGYITLHDPTSGELHDLAVKDAPDWAVREARKRKELWAGGNKKAFTMTARAMEKLWESECVPDPEGIVEDHPIEEEED